jgi:hypothetical protein
MSKYELPKEYYLEKPGHYDEATILKRMRVIFKQCTIINLVDAHEFFIGLFREEEHDVIAYDIFIFLCDVYEDVPDLDQELFLRHYMSLLFDSGFFLLI